MKYKVLLVDDEKISKFVQEYLIDFYKWEVDWIRDPEQAFDLATNKIYDVLILDIMLQINDDSFLRNKEIPNEMGLLTGIELAKSIYDHKKGNGFPKIVFLTARREQIIERYLKKNEHYHCYYKKPCEMEDLVKGIETILKR